MKILIATFDHKYYLWQCLVQINNFSKYGYDKDTIFVIATDPNNPSKELKSIIENPKIKSKFFLYPDDRPSHKYPSSLRFHILEKLFREKPEYEKEMFFYTDPDVVFTKYFDFSKFEKDDILYVSDTRSYLDSNYIKSKSEKLFNEMCDIIGISPELVIENDKNAGGAQYILKNINSNFWDVCRDKSEILYNHMKDTSTIYKPEHPIQFWTSDMWTLFWEGLKRGQEFKINRDLDFCWAVSNISQWYDKYIFHNAGVPGDSDEFFSKITYQESPFNKKLVENKKNCTYKYVQEIKETEERFSDIVW
jgi:hypothetical protein